MPSGVAHGERAPVSWANISVADFGGTGVSDCAVGDTARDTSGSNPSSFGASGLEVKPIAMVGGASDWGASRLAETSGCGN